MPKKITEDEFRLIKNKLSWGRNPRLVAREVGRSFAKVSIISTCKNFKEYELIKEAEHPPIKNSLADRVTDLEHRVDALERGSTQLAFDLNKDELND